MKVYNKVVIDMNTNEILEEDSFEYEGEVAQAGAAAIPLVVAAIGAGSAAYTARQSRKASKEASELARQPLEELTLPEADQPIEPTDTLREQELLAAEQKRKKQGYLQSFGGLDESSAYGLI